MNTKQIISDFSANPSVLGVLVASRDGMIEGQAGEPLESLMENVGVYWHIAQLVGQDLRLSGLTQLQFSGPERNFTCGQTQAGRNYFLTTKPKTDVKLLTNSLTDAL
jgi:hypothetical protein